MKEYSFNITDEYTKQRLDRFLSLKLPDFSRSFLQKLIEQDYVLINETPAQKNAILKTGDVISVKVPQNDPFELIAQNIPLSIIYEDDDLLIVDKPKGMVVHPAAGNPNNTLVNALLYHCGSNLSSLNGDLRPGIVHRIDKDTSGILIVAKNDDSHQNIAEQLKSHELKRQYLAVLNGNLKEVSGFVDAAIGRSAKDRKKQAINGINAREAKTHYNCIAYYKDFCLAKCSLVTGRTHQIRLHMSHIGHSIAGDITYGGKNNDFSLGGQCLHSFKIGFVHPKTGKSLEFYSPLPEYFLNFLDKLKFLTD